MTIHYRKLARGTFELPAFEEGSAKVEVDSATLALILEGIELRSAVRRKRHTRSG